MNESVPNGVIANNSLALTVHESILKIRVLQDKLAKAAKLVGDLKREMKANKKRADGFERALSNSDVQLIALAMKAKEVVRAARWYFSSIAAMAADPLCEHIPSPMDAFDEILRMAERGS